MLYFNKKNGKLSSADSPQTSCLWRLGYYPSFAKKGLQKKSAPSLSFFSADVHDHNSISSITQSIYCNVMYGVTISLEKII